MMSTPVIIAVSRSKTHSFSKPNEMSIRLVPGLGVEGDAHFGATVKHRHTMQKNPQAPNRRQVHLIDMERLEEFAQHGFDVKPGEMGENVTVRGVNLLDLPQGTRLRLGARALIEITGLRKPCSLIDKFQSGLMAETISKREDGRVLWKAGVMSIVLEGGDIHAGDAITVILPEGPHRPLEKVD
jgi:MOSC domain-containing protein YiiM